MKPEQAKAILANAPEGATHFDIDDDLYLKYKPDEQAWDFFSMNLGIWGSINEVDELHFIHALSDLRQIVAQADRIEALEKALENMIYWAELGMSNPKMCQEIDAANKLLGE